MRHTFRLEDVTGDNRLLARSAYGYDWNYFADEESADWGNSQDVRMRWDTSDANANEFLIELPAGGTVNVPVIAIGQSILNRDLGLYNGVVDPRVAMFGVGAVTTGPILEFRKARGTIAAPTVVTTADDMGAIDFYGAVAAGEYVRGARILAEMTGTIATTRGPGVLTFQTATDAAPSVLTTGLTISAAQVVTMAAVVITTTTTFNGNLVLPANTDLTFTGTTGTNDIVLTNALADALSITDGAADVMVFDTSTAGNVITVTGAILGNLAITSAGAAGGIGYATGAGGTVTQMTNKSTGVTLNTVTGIITMNAAALAGDVTVAFTLTDTSIAATDAVIVLHESAGTIGAYSFGSTAAAGSAVISVHNNTAGSLSEAIVLRFVVIKSVNA